MPKRACPSKVLAAIALLLYLTARIPLAFGSRQFVLGGVLSIGRITFAKSADFDGANAATRCSTRSLSWENFSK